VGRDGAAPVRQQLALLLSDDRLTRLVRAQVEGRRVPPCSSDGSPTSLAPDRPVRPPPLPLAPASHRLTFFSSSHSPSRAAPPPSTSTAPSSPSRTRTSALRSSRSSKAPHRRQLRSSPRSARSSAASSASGRLPRARGARRPRLLARRFASQLARKISGSGERVRPTRAPTSRRGAHARRPSRASPTTSRRRPRLPPLPPQPPPPLRRRPRPRSRPPRRSTPPSRSSTRAAGRGGFRPCGGGGTGSCAP